ncbi:MAG: extracellular solute-binding protein [Pseudomonadota bacterium]
MNSPRHLRHSIIRGARHCRQNTRLIIGFSLSFFLGGVAAATADSHEATTISHGYSNFGELKYGPDEPFSYVNVDAPKSGEISLAAEGTFDSFNPFVRKGVVASGSTLPYEDLMIAAADDPYGIYCNLCTTIEYPESIDWVIVNLREDVTFSDGSPMTAEDVKFTTDLFFEQGITEFREVFNRFYESIEVLGPYTIKFTFADDTPLRDRVGLVGFWNPFSKAYFEANALRLDDSQTEPFLGTGPYVLAEVDFGRSVFYEKNPDWWGADLPINQGRFNFDRIRYEYFSDASAALEGFKVGEYTFRVENTSRIWATAYDFPALNDGFVQKESLIDGSITNAQGFVFNLRRPEWQDPRVRDAVRLLFNFEFTNRTLFYDLYQRPASFWGGSDLAADGAPDGVEAEVLQGLVDDGLLEASILTEPARIPPINTSEQNAPDRKVYAEAERLFGEAGWVPDDAGQLRNASGETLDLVILQRSQAFDRIVNPFVENLERAGINAKLERVDDSQYTERRRTGLWDLVNHSPGQDFEPSTGLKQWFASETAEDSSRNIMALQDPAVDALIDEVIAAKTLDDLRPRVRALDRVLRAHGFWLAQWTNQEHWVAYWDMYDYPKPFPPLSVTLFSLAAIDFWWHDEDGEARLRDAGALN